MSNASRRKNAARSVSSIRRAGIVLLAMATGGLLLAQTGGFFSRPSTPNEASSRVASTNWQGLLFHDSYNSFYRSPFGAAPTGSTVTLRFIGPATLTSAAIALSNINGNSYRTAVIPMTKLPAAAIRLAPELASTAGRAVWQGEIPASDLAVAGVLSYDFIAKNNHTTVYYANNGNGYGGVGSVNTLQFESVYYHITVYDRHFTTPSWLTHGIIYEIFPDRFYNGNPKNDENPLKQLAIGYASNGSEKLVPVQFHKNWYSTPYDPNVTVALGTKYAKAQQAIHGDGNWSTDFYGGDLQGITDKLAYLQSLGVNTLYLTPIFQAESNHKYDTGNFLAIDPGFGTLKDYVTLIKAAKARGMHIILDGVFEDTGSDSLYFNKFNTYRSVGAWQQFLNSKKRSSYYNWYQWSPGATPPYVGWSGVDTLPQTNTTGRPWQQFVYGKSDPKNPTNPSKSAVARYWLSMGASGWRLDSANNSNYSIAWWTAFRQAVKQTDPNAAIIGEDWNDPTNDNGTDWLTGTTWDSTMNYPFRNDVISFFRGTYNDGNVQNYAFSAQDLSHTLMQMIEEYPKPAMYAEMNLFGSHDTERILTILEGAPNASQLTAFQQATWKPTAAQQTLGIAKFKLAAAFQYGFVGVPMIYYGDEAGLIGYKDPLDRAAYPWGRANQNLVSYFQLLGHIRNTHPVLQVGNYSPLYAGAKAMAFARTIRGGVDALGHLAVNDTALVAINNGRAQIVQLNVSGELKNGAVLYDALHGSVAYTVHSGTVTLPLGTYQGAILVTDK